MRENKKCGISLYTMAYHRRGIGVIMTDEKYKRLSLKKFDRMSIFILMGYTAVMQCKLYEDRIL